MLPSHDTCSPRGNRFRCPEPQQWYNRPPNPLLSHGSKENASSKRLFFDLFAILALAALARLAFFSEALGTDEIVYLTRAQHILHWEYPQAVYIGAMRDGINIFLAASIFLFGTGIGGASGLFFACSLGQVVLAFGFAYSLWGRRAAIWAALVMAACQSKSP
jgi:hypothetical protein